MCQQEMKTPDYLNIDGRYSAAYHEQQDRNKNLPVEEKDRLPRMRMAVLVHRRVRGPYSTKSMADLTFGLRFARFIEQFFRKSFV